MTRQSRLLKRTHLRRWYARALAAAYLQYASLGPARSALHLGPFEQPGQNQIPQPPAGLVGVLVVLGLLGLLGAVWAGPLSAAEMVHGENSEFAGRGVAMVWAILKAPVEEQSQVVVRIARLDPAYVSISIDGVDPFDQRRREVLGRTRLGEVFETRIARGTFADFTRREFHLYTAQDEQARVPSLTVYYMGVPDTAPEFLTESALSAYLTDALRKVQGGVGGRRP
jgi:hypothetical protein